MCSAVLSQTAQLQTDRFARQKSHVCRSLPSVDALLAWSRGSRGMIKPTAMTYTLTYTHKVPYTRENEPYFRGLVLQPAGSIACRQASEAECVADDEAVVVAKLDLQSCSSSSSSSRSRSSSSSSSSSSR